MRRVSSDERAAPAASRVVAEPGVGAAPASERLQRTIGNRALCSRLVLHAPDSPMEQEAHRVAAAVTTGTGERAPPTISRAAPGLARLATGHGPGDMSGGMALGDGWATRLAARRGAGQALAGAARPRLEAGFGVGLDAVRVHSDGAAAGLCRDLGAEAFTHGRDIYFAEGRYTPETPRGASLLAHEVTHTIQQSGLTREGEGLAVRAGGAASPAIQGLITRANFVKLAGGDSVWGWTKNSTYHNLLAAVDSYHSARTDTTRKAALAEVVRLGGVWKKKHTEDHGTRTSDVRRDHYMNGLIGEAEAELAGQAAPAYSPSAIIDTRTQAGDTVVNQASTAVQDTTRRYSFMVRALVEHRLRGRFTERRAQLTAGNKLKVGKYRKSSDQLKTEAARETVLADDPTLADSAKKRELRAAIDSVSRAGVGHTWVVLIQRNASGQEVDRKSFGFYPTIPLAQATLEARAGEVSHPERHDSQGGSIREREWDIGFDRYTTGLDALGRLMRSPPDYKLAGYNCTYFAKVVGAEVGVQIPDAYFTLPNLTSAWNPNTLYDLLV